MTLNNDQTHRSSSLPEQVPTLHAFDRMGNDGGTRYSYNSVGTWTDPQTNSAVIVSRTIEGYLLGQPDLHNALARWANERYRLPDTPGQPYTALVLQSASPTSLKLFAQAIRDGAERAEVMIDGRFLFGFGHRRGYLHERYEWEMTCGLRVERYADGTYRFSENT